MLIFRFVYLSQFSELNESLNDSTCEEDNSEDSWVTEEETEIDINEADMLVCYNVFPPSFI